MSSSEDDSEMNKSDSESDSGKDDFPSFWSTLLGPELTAIGSSIISCINDWNLVPGKNEFAIQWKIKNFSMFGSKENNCLTSKTAVVPMLDNSKWHLKLLSKEQSIMCFLCRIDGGRYGKKVFYSIISVDSSKAVEQKLETFEKKSSSTIHAVINQEEFISKVSQGLSKDILHIECRLCLAVDPIAIQTRTIPCSVSMSTSTEIVVEDRSFFYEVKNFSSLPELERISFGLPSAGYGGVKLICRLWVEGETIRVILREQEASAQDQLFVLKCKIHVLDIFRKRHLLHSGRAVFNSKGDGSDKTWNFPLSMSKEELMEKKDLYLPGDALLLHFEIAVSDTSSVKLLKSTVYSSSDVSNKNRNIRWGTYLNLKYKEHRVFCRILAILVVVLCVLPHLFFDSTLIPSAFQDVANLLR